MSLGYIIITPAKNEERNIENTISSMVAQTQKPIKWIIVNDNSTDNTGKIARKYADHYAWICLVNLNEGKNRNFAAKVRAFNAGLDQIRNESYHVIGNLDADLTFEPDYFEYLISQFDNSPRLGVAGTPFVDDGKTYNYRFTKIEHVSGGCQLFRKECFEEIGGYQPIKEGGIDWLAVTTARMRGWETKTFTGKQIIHQRKIGTGNKSIYKALFDLGKKDYNLGNTFHWEMMRIIYQAAKSKPYILSGTLLMAGYLSKVLKRAKRPISSQLLSFVRKEQNERIRKILTLSF